MASAPPRGAGDVLRRAGMRLDVTAGMRLDLTLEIHIQSPPREANLKLTLGQSRLRGLTHKGRIGQHSLGKDSFLTVGKEEGKF